MNKKDTINRNIILILMIVVAAAFRLITFKYKELSNFTPVGAIAVFGGVYFTEKWKGYVTVLLTLFTTDIIINYLYTSKVTLWYSGAAWVYLCFALMVLVGSFIKKVNVLNVLLAAVASVLIHWLIIDLPFLYGTLYPHTLAGYGQSLVKAIPFEKNMVLGDMVFGLLLFGGFELAKTRYTFLRTQKQLAL
ncbi:DUF6580 family putative transport protein [Mucilaginibacter sp. AW1-7]|jgi:hypothetical protein|uniref:DUF6580 family putative transport protein n=1 Tax=unclassified Mucilaginibacter TaxID=2617802 RepID=UPI0008BE8ECA|nr:MULTISPECIES: DUF6580 family putative transport protein [unclassified Mucilaginibacter]WDF81013.1 hypothetical protein PQ469_13460 [Mucilaginibacter sp. KACC 22773]SEP15867.1 hypothetical protein SAMN05428947_107255 [Mucilaginibacter sp. OK283]